MDSPAETVYPKLALGFTVLFLAECITQSKELVSKMAPNFSLILKASPAFILLVLCIHL